MTGAIGSNDFQRYTRVINLIFCPYWLGGFMYTCLSGYVSTGIGGFITKFKREKMDQSILYNGFTEGLVS